MTTILPTTNSPSPVASCLDRSRALIAVSRDFLAASWTRWSARVYDLALLLLLVALAFVSGYTLGVNPGRDIMAGILTPFLFVAVCVLFVVWRRMGEARGKGGR